MVQKMRHGSSRRNRNRNNNGGRRKGNGKSQVYDSNGPDVRIRGTAHQIAEKYQALAKDSSSSGDYIMAESYLQHAEHYLRIISSMHPPAREPDTSSDSVQKSAQEDADLSLPASIIGVKSNSESQEKAVETV